MIPMMKKAKLEGRNAYNTIFRAVVDPNAPYPQAIMCQELVEGKIKRNIVGGCLALGVLTGVGVGVLTEPVMGILPALVGFAAGAVTTKLSTFRRSLELLGHEVEVQAAVQIYGVNEARYRRLEAESMVKHAKYGFGGWWPYEVELAMERNKRDAKDRLASLNLVKIGKFFGGK